MPDADVPPRGRLVPGPVVAVLTIGIAFLGSLWWTLSWFVLGAVIGKSAREWAEQTAK